MKNRTIKFRAYHIKAKRMFNVEKIIFEPYYRVFGLRDAWFDIGFEVELMQFTGLKDKNMKEIYEGDILATENDGAEFDKWNEKDNGYTVVTWSEDGDSWIGNNWTWDKTNDRESIYDISFCKVIGNIYENPELLK